MMANLIIFDIDGTLTQTEHIDSKAYFDAFSDYLGINVIDTNWAEYNYSTDSGIALELFKKHICREPNLKEIRAIQNKFFKLLENQIQNNKLFCHPLPGANTIFERIIHLTNWHIAIATGCWRNSAFIKLRYANLPYEDIPLSCGDDDIERHSIINIAIDRAKIYYQQKKYNTVVYVGDKQWDLQASRKLEIKFIGVGESFVQSESVDFPVIKNYLSNNLLFYLNEMA